MPSDCCYFVDKAAAAAAAPALKYFALFYTALRFLHRIWDRPGNALQSLTDSTISISELLEIVKDKHPEILSADVLAHYDLSRGNSELERGLKFSLKDTTELKAENKKLIEDNDKQRRYIRELESAVGLNKKELDERAIRRLSGQILREYSGVYDKVVWSLMLKVTLKSDILFLCNF